MFYVKHLFKYRVLSHIPLTALRVGSVHRLLLFTRLQKDPGCGSSNVDDFSSWSKVKGHSLGVLVD